MADSSNSFILLVSVTISAVVLRQTTAAVTRPITILSAKREEVPQNGTNQFTVRFTKIDQEPAEFYFKKEPNGAKKRIQLINIPSGFSAKFEVDRDYRNPEVLILTDNKRNGAHIYLDNTGTDTQSYNSVNYQPRYSITPKFSARYQPNEIVQVTFKMADYTGDEGEYYLTPTFAGSWNQSQFIALSGVGSFITAETLRKTDNMHKVRYYLNMTQSSVSGFFVVMMENNFPRGPMKRIKLRSSIKVKPDGQSGLVPRGFLQVLSQTCSSPQNTDESICTCKVGDSCHLNCIAYGSNLNQMWLRDANNNIVTNVERSPRLIRQIEDIHWNVTPTSSSGGANSTMTFTCGTSNKGRNQPTKSKTIRVRVVA